MLELTPAVQRPIIQVPEGEVILPHSNNTSGELENQNLKDKTNDEREINGRNGISISISRLNLSKKNS
jgi:hypothetical protein